MYLHIGQDTLINTSEVLGVFDMDTTSISKATREFFKVAEQKGIVVNVTQELPKSYVLCASKKCRAHEKKSGEEALYISQLNTATLKKRLAQGNFAKTFE